MAVPSQVYNLGNACKRFLFSAEVIGMLTLTIFENELTIPIGIRLLIETIAAGYFYLQCSDSAGEPVVEQEDHELSQLSFSGLRGDYEQFESQTPDRNECQECKIIQSYRTKHCSKCQKCIPKYDHHCFWIGGCVGELNHRMYWLFLFFQCLLCFDGMFQFKKQFPYYSTYDEEFGHDEYQYQYFIILLTAATSFGFGIFTGALLLYHTMLILTGKTTWEHTKRDKISYLNFYPRYYHPYNFGFIENIKITFFHKGLQSHWIPPSKDQIKEQCNIFDNKYYSCC
ncbi:unnamed protein product (macronuclear) [Paramecium tetraurelia]|uniref:Palmitoyltransferase n=1 Tax=Paramecium tetraurelia TaxID=5888 RepID=A0E767_PARTE|nr:uncharacterized protein GSPATT00023862001 [Paramecium tetraurelia]CAK91134.1 unnamed protein product [Paramecium tetraurelia]|eukprot:XP_001458531.1 hypothetical protein (macronuclear) [Paramecium tetraurelia strain d4-2]